MTKPLSPDDLRKGKWFVIISKKTRPPPSIQIGNDTMQLMPIMAMQEFESNGIPIYILAVSLPFIVGSPIVAPHTICTVDITRYEIREPSRQYVQAFIKPNPLPESLS